MQINLAVSKKTATFATSKLTNLKHKIMEQKIYFKNKVDLKKKACELIDNLVDFKTVENCIIIKKKPNIHVLYKCKSGLKEKEFYIEAQTMLETVNTLYAQINLEKEFGEIGRIVSVGIIR